MWFCQHLYGGGDLSSTEPRYVGSLFRKAWFLLYFDTSAKHSGLVYDVTDTVSGTE